MKKLAILVLLFACGGASETALHPESRSEPTEQPEAEPEERSAAEPPKPTVEWIGLPERAEFPSLPKQMFVIADEQFIPYLEVAIEKFQRRLGIRIVISEGGIPIGYSKSLGTESHPLAGQALTQHWCSFDTCDPVHTRTRVWISEDKPEFLQQVLEHELGHVISGWGGCTKEKDAAGHVPDAPGDLMSNPAGRVWGQESINLLCSCGACSEINSDEMAR